MRGVICNRGCSLFAIRFGTLSACVGSIFWWNMAPMMVARSYNINVSPLCIDCGGVSRVTKPGGASSTLSGCETAFFKFLSNSRGTNSFRSEPENVSKAIAKRSSVWMIVDKLLLSKPIYSRAACIVATPSFSVNHLRSLRVLASKWSQAYKATSGCTICPARRVLGRVRE